MTVTPTTPQTIEGVTVSEPNENGKSEVVIPGWVTLLANSKQVRAMGLTVPEPTVPCRIGDTEFTLTRADMEALSTWRNASGAVGAIGAAARAHLDVDNEEGR